MVAAALFAAALFAGVGLGAAGEAAACACCAQPGARRLQEQVIDRASVTLLASLRFEPSAHYDGVWLGSDNAADTEGPSAPETYPLSVIYSADGWTLTLTGPAGGVGALAFPATSLFTRSAIDLAPGALAGAEPAYYVEWRFRAAVAAIGGLGGLDARPAELVFHGSGDECFEGDRLGYFSLTIEPLAGADGRPERLFGAQGGASEPPSAP